MKPMMNEAKLKACLKRGKSRKECMAEVYPEKPGKKGGDAAKKKTPMKGKNPFA